MVFLIPVPNIEIALAKFAKWEEKRVKLGFPEDTVRIIATGDPDLPWVVEVLDELIETEDEI